MRIYVDANFILQHSLEQEDFPFVSEIYQLVRSQGHQLKCPVVAFMESISHLSARNAWRGNLRELLDRHKSIDDLSRSGLHFDALEKVRETRDYLLGLRDDEESRLDRSLDYFFAEKGELLPFGDNCLSRAKQLRKSPSQLRLADSYVAAAIELDLQTGDHPPAPPFPSLFVTGDQGFAFLAHEFKSFGCKLITNFPAAVDFIRFSSQAN